jgi:hypothetical protein
VFLHNQDEAALDNGTVQDAGRPSQKGCCGDEQGQRAQVRELAKNGKTFVYTFRRTMRTFPRNEPV